MNPGDNCCQTTGIRTHKEAEAEAEAEAAEAVEAAETWAGGGEVEFREAAGHDLVTKTAARCGGLELVVEEEVVLLLLRPALLCERAQVVVRLRGRWRADFCRP